MKISIGTDHGGFKMKEQIVSYLNKKGVDVLDAGPFSEDRCDYPIFADSVTDMVLSKKAKYGILICKSGIGMSIAANRKKGIRAALCSSVKAARLSREHNNANVLAFGSSFVSLQLAKKMCDIFLKTEFAGGRHKRRVRLMDIMKRD